MRARKRNSKLWAGVWEDWELNSKLFAGVSYAWKLKTETLLVSFGRPETQPSTAGKRLFSYIKNKVTEPTFSFLGGKLMDVDKS